MTRSLSLTTLLLLNMAVVPRTACGAADDARRLRPAVAKLLSDKMIARVELSESFRAVRLGNNPWSESGVTLLAITPSGRYTDGYAVVGKKSEQLVGFVGPEPRPPVPMEVIPRARAVEVAKDFCSRQLPELSAPGGEVSVSVDDNITEYGAWMVRLRRNVQGVRVPTVADVGVRVYDGKVVWFRRRCLPLKASLTLGRLKAYPHYTAPQNGNAYRRRLRIANVLFYFGHSLLDRGGTLLTSAGRHVYGSHVQLCNVGMTLDGQPYHLSGGQDVWGNVDDYTLGVTQAQSGLTLEDIPKRAGQ